MRRQGRHCAECRAHRLHYVRPRKDPATGAVRRCWVCTGCSAATPIPIRDAPGINCPSCGDCRLKTLFTNHQRPGVDVRKLRCKHCSKTLSVRETVLTAA